MQDSIVIDPRFCGPEHSANGGYACGCLAELLPDHMHGGVQVNLRAPPPLGRVLHRDVHEKDSDKQVTLRYADKGQTLADARPVPCTIQAPTPPSFAEAKLLSLHTHPAQHALRQCFVCGTQRSPETGLRLFPGRAPETPEAPVCAAWRPHAAFVDTEGFVHQRIMWSALDCPGYFGVAAPGELALLASMTARMIARPRADEACVVMGWSLGRAGRKLKAGTAIFGESGALLGLSQQLWIALRPEQLPVS